MPDPVGVEVVLCATACHDRVVVCPDYLVDKAHAGVDLVDCIQPGVTSLEYVNELVVRTAVDGN